MPTPPAAPASLTASTPEPGVLLLSLRGRLDVRETGALWRRARALLEREAPRALVVDAAAVEYCDGAGLAFLFELRRRNAEASRSFELKNLPEQFARLLAMFDPDELGCVTCDEPRPRHLVAHVGETTAHLWRDFLSLLAFVGELSSALVGALVRPRSVRWKDALLAAETAGILSLPIISLVSFLIGMIMAFQSAVPMKAFGTEIYVADLVALAMLRELGPLMSAVLLAGRSGSAFAAELGTMKINEEVDALTTFGLDPVRFLVVTRVIGLVVVTPFLALFADLMGLLGGAVVYLTLHFPLTTYVHQVLARVTLADFLGGLFKALVFGILVSAIGCLRGLQTKTGPSAVGSSATRAVVSGILMIVLTDGLISVIFYVLEI